MSFTPISPPSDQRVEEVLLDDSFSGAAHRGDDVAFDEGVGQIGRAAGGRGHGRHWVQITTV